MLIKRGVLVLLIGACIALPAYGQSASLPKMPSLGFEQGSFPLVKPVRGTAVIDRENEVIRVVAYGTCDTLEDETDAECIATAYSVARAHGMRNLSEILGELKINEDLNLNGIYKVNNEVVIQSNALLKQVRPLRGDASNGVAYRGYQYMPDNSIIAWVTLETVLDQVSIGQALEHPDVRDKLEERLVARSRELQEKPIQVAPEPVDVLIPEPVTPSEDSQDYTGLIIDTSRFSVTDIMVAPSVLGASGQRVYDLNRVTRRVRLSGQIVRPCPSIEKARTYVDKVGDTPLILFAALADKGDIILSDKDVEKLEVANKKSDFLRHGRVIIVY